jgi:hypothetical protein
MALDFWWRWGKDSGSVSDSEDSFDDGFKDLVIDSFEDRTEHNEGFRLTEVPLDCGNIAASFILAGNSEDVIEENLTQSLLDHLEVGSDFLDWELRFIDTGKPRLAALGEA